MLRLVILWGAAVFAAPLAAQDFTFITDPLTIEYDVATGVGSGTLRITNLETLGPGALPSQVEGWALSFTMGTADVIPIEVTQGSYIQTVNNGAPPEFWVTDICNEGVVTYAVYNFVVGSVSCTYEIAREIMLVELESVPASLIGNDVGGPFSLDSMLPTCFPSAISDTVVVGGTSFAPTWFFDSLELVPIGLPFLRGDANNDGTVQTIPDAIALLNALFTSSGPIACESAGDINDDGAVNLADAIFLLGWGFSFGPTPPAPFPTCGLEATPGGLSCVLTSC